MDRGQRDCFLYFLPAGGAGADARNDHVLYGISFEFSQLDEELVWCFAARFGEYWDRYQLLTEQERTQAALAEMRYDSYNRLLESERRAAVRAAESQSTALLHEAKGVYTSAILLLHDARDASPAQRTRLRLNDAYRSCRPGRSVSTGLNFWTSLLPAQWT